MDALYEAGEGGDEWWETLRDVWLDNENESIDKDDLISELVDGSIENMRAIGLSYDEIDSQYIYESIRDCVDAVFKKYA